MKNTAFPDHWERPKYHLGQRVKQGEIIGVEYHPLGTQRAYELGDGWTYTVLVDEHSDEVENLEEKRIEPLSTEELQTQVQELIDLYQGRIASLTEQLKGVGQ